MISLNDYLYNGDTVLKIIKNYSEALKIESKEKNNPIDLAHANFLLQIEDLLIHNDFLSSQSQRIREFYKYMAKEYPFLAFTFKGRIKSLIRAEGKFNGYIVNYVNKYYAENGSFPDISDLKSRLNQLHDLIAYRIVISLPKCHLEEGQDREKEEIKYLYEIANKLPSFLEERGFTAKLSNSKIGTENSGFSEEARPYYKDYIEHVKPSGYRSLHITFYDNISRSFIEVQLRTKDMDDFSEIGNANHYAYEENQNQKRNMREAILEGECGYFDDAYRRTKLLQELDLSKLDVNMFTAVDNSLINDGCGLFRGRLILPFEHLSRFQNDRID